MSVFAWVISIMIVGMFFLFMLFVPFILLFLPTSTLLKWFSLFMSAFLFVWAMALTLPPETGIPPLPLIPFALYALVAWRHWFHPIVKPVPEGYCRKCRYNLTGNVSGICPECGEKIVDPVKPVDIHGKT